MVVVEIKEKITFSSIYEFFYSIIKKDEIKKLKEKYTEISNIEETDEIIEKLFDKGYCDEDIITNILEDREEKYIINYNEQQDMFEVHEIEVA